MQIASHLERIALQGGTATPSAFMPRANPRTRCRRSTIRRVNMGYLVGSLDPCRNVSKACGGTEPFRQGLSRLCNACRNGVWASMAFARQLQRWPKTPAHARVQLRDAQHLSQAKRLYDGIAGEAWLPLCGPAVEPRSGTVCASPVLAPRRRVGRLPTRVLHPRSATTNPRQCATRKDSPISVAAAPSSGDPNCTCGYMPC